MFSISFFHEIEKTSNNYYVSVMQEHLQRCFEGAEGEATGIGHAEFWKSGGIASGLNGGAIARVCQRLIKALRPPSDFIGDI